ncbi:phosphodiesterase [Microbacterium phage Hendrix]|uniref:Hydrolase n=1 Tax=Microbacterium phage Hendrix TaxID=2182341 RepID=A0A2U8UUI0_9CAUD|nr:phosphodiesterase [Microbacterium phage Hendrix]AWN07733.1 hydrolase [Microbacterium phage Hendrix]
MPVPQLLAAPAARGGQGDIITADFTTFLPAVNGHVRIMAGRSQGTVPADITPPAGWARAGTSGTAPVNDRFTGIFFKRITDALTEPDTVAFSGVSAGANSRLESATLVVTGVDPAFVNDAGLRYRPDAFLPSITVPEVPALLIAIWAAEFTAGVSVIPNSVPAGLTVRLITQTAGGSNPAPVLDNSVTTGSRTGLIVATMELPAGSSKVIPDMTMGWASAPTSIKSASMVLRGAPEEGIGVPVKRGNGAAAKLSFLNGAGVRKAPTRAAIWLPGFADVEQLLATPGATMAHRGGSANWPEFSEVAYDRSVFRDYGLLEFSCGWTSDLVPFGLGDQYLDSAAGVTGSIDPNTLTWAQIASTYQNKLRPIQSGVFQPFYRLEQFLEKYTPHHVVAVDPKFGWNTPAKYNAMLDICDAHGGPDKIVIKFDSPVNLHGLIDAAHLRGYIGMNYWGTEPEKLTPTYGTDRWDLIGIRYDAVQSTYDAAIAIGKPVWAAVIPTQAGYDLAATQGADLMMCSNVAGIAPVS